MTRNTAQKPATPAGKSTPPGAAAQRLWPLAIVMAVLVAFGRAAAADFVLWDDPISLYQNPQLNPPTWAGAAHYWLHSAHGLYIPLTYTVWALLAALTNGPADAHEIAMNPWVFHGFNVLLHVASALVAWAILGRFVSRAAAGVGAMFFALHPVQVEAVAWAAGMKDVLSGLLVLLALWQYVEYVRARQRKALSEESPNTDRSLNVHAESAYAAGAHYGLALGAFILAMLAKPSAMVAPALVFVIDWWLLGRSPKKVLGALATWFALSLACAVSARLAQVTDLQPAPLWARPLIAGDALAFYLSKLIWPCSLGIDYGRRPDVVMGHWWFYAAWIIPAATATLLWLNRRRAPELLVAGAVFLIALSPVLGLVPFQFQYLSTVTDHYLYVAILGPALAVGWLFDRAVRRVPFSAVAAAAAVMLIALGAKTVHQTGVWLDNLALFSNAVAVNPRSVVCLTSLGRTHLANGNAPEAESTFKRALEVDPNSWLARENLAALLELKGDFPAAVEQHKLSLGVMQRRLRSSERAQVPLTAAALARDLAILGRYEEARKYIRLALEYRPDDPMILSLAQEIDRRAAVTPQLSQPP